MLTPNRMRVCPECDAMLQHQAPFARCRPALFGTAILARTLFAIGTIAAGVATYEWISGSKKHLAQRIDHLEEQLMTSKPQIATPPPTSQ
mmetsp:Transcript_19030/g.46785  ORF Transcript_19030/g.46785 Transcript_19030/m.46785 type:complete len:90 (+) Transcript_19030:344-613(+)